MQFDLAFFSQSLTTTLIIMFGSIFRVYSYFGVLSIKFDKNEIKNSRALGIFNILRVFAMWLVLIFVLKSNEFRNLTLKQEMLSSKSFSAFSKNIGVVFGLFLNFTASAVWVMNCIKRKKITNFLDEVHKCPISKSKFQVLWTKHSLIVLVSFILINAVQVITKVRFTLLSIGTFILLIQPYLITLGFMSFVKTFEYFFFICLEDFKQYLINSEFQQNDIELIRKFKYIYDLNQSFKANFGFQITLTVLGVSSFLTVQVCFWFKNDYFETN